MIMVLMTLEIIMMLPSLPSCLDVSKYRSIKVSCKSSIYSSASKGQNFQEYHHLFSVVLLQEMCLS